MCIGYVDNEISLAFQISALRDMSLVSHSETLLMTILMWHVGAENNI